MKREEKKKKGLMTWVSVWIPVFLDFLVENITESYVPNGWV